MSLPAYADYRESEVAWLGRLPAHWAVKRFKWIIERNDGGVWGEDPSGEADTVVLRSTEQTVDGYWKIDDPARRKLTDIEKLSSTLETGDLLVTKSSGSSLHIGKTTLVDEQIASLSCCYSNFMQRIRLTDAFRPKLAWYVMNNDLARLQLDLLSNSTTGLANLNGTMIGEILLPVASDEEQTAIEVFLDRETAKIDALIAEQEKLLALLAEKRQATISHAVTRGLNPNASMKDSGIPWLGDVPMHWKLRRLTEVCRFQSGKAHEPFIDDEGQFICVNSRFVSTSGLSRKYCTQNLSPAKKDDILMVMSDLPNGRALAKAFYVNDEAAYAVNQRVCILSPFATNARFMYYLLDRNPHFMRYDDGVNQTHLPNAAFEKFKAHIPPLPEQERIAGFLDKVTQKFDELTAHAISAMELLAERRSALVAAAVTGKIDVRGAIETKAA